MENAFPNRLGNYHSFKPDVNYNEERKQLADSGT